MKRFFGSVKYAFNGVLLFLRSDRNGKIHAAFALTAIVLSIIYSIPVHQWMIILFCIALVLSLEMINASMETLCDHVTGIYHPAIKKIKDMAAGAVLLASIISLVVGILIFLPLLVSTINSFQL